MPRTKQQNEELKAEKRSVIIDAALQLFTEYGYAHTSIDKIAKKVGMAKGLFYTYFESKEDLLVQILNSWKEKLSPDTFKENMTVDEFILSIEKIIDNMNEHKDFYMLYTALSTQPNINLSSLSTKLTTQNDYQKMIISIVTLYQKHFGEKYLEEMLTMVMMLKGFSIIYLFGAGRNIFPVETMKASLIHFLKTQFIHSKIENI